MRFAGRLGQVREAVFASHGPENGVREELHDVLVEEGGDDTRDDHRQHALEEPVPEFAQMLRERHPPLGGVLLLFEGRLEQPTSSSRAQADAQGRPSISS